MNKFRIAVLCALTAVGVGPAHAFPSSPSGKLASPQAAASRSKKKIKKKRSKREPTQQAPTADRISEIQSALARGGYYQGDPNGKWDANTIVAVEKFQSAHGIDSSGKLDAPTLQKLGLGSDIAGVSAPKPVTPSSSATPPASQPRTTSPSGASNGQGGGTSPSSVAAVPANSGSLAARP